MLTQFLPLWLTYVSATWGLSPINAPTPTPTPTEEGDQSRGDAAERLLRRLMLPMIPEYVLQRRREVCSVTEAAVIGKIVRVHRAQESWGAHRWVSESIDFTVEGTFFGEGLTSVTVARRGEPGDVDAAQVPAQPSREVGARYLLLLRRDTESNELTPVGNGLGAIELSSLPPVPPPAVLRRIWKLECSPLGASSGRVSWK